LLAPDIAIGLGALLGFVFPAERDRPYHRSLGLPSCWRLLHMTLSRFPPPSLRDFLYIPLGRQYLAGRFRTYTEPISTMVLGRAPGHGAVPWTFVLWCAFHGAVLFAEHALACDRGTRVRRGLPLVVTFHLIVFGWILVSAAGRRWGRLPESLSAGVGLRFWTVPGGCRDPGLDRYPATIAGLNPRDATAGRTERFQHAATLVTALAVVILPFSSRPPWPSPGVPPLLLFPLQGVRRA